MTPAFWLLSLRPVSFLDPEASSGAPETYWYYHYFRAVQRGPECHSRSIFLFNYQVTMHFSRCFYFILDKYSVTILQKVLPMRANPSIAPALRHFFRSIRRMGDIRFRGTHLLWVEAPPLTSQTLHSPPGPPPVSMAPGTAFRKKNAPYRTVETDAGRVPLPFPDGTATTPGTCRKGAVLCQQISAPERGAETPAAAGAPGVLHQPDQEKGGVYIPVSGEDPLRPGNCGQQCVRRHVNFASIRNQ